MGDIADWLYENFDTECEDEYYEGSRNANVSCKYCGKNGLRWRQFIVDRPKGATTQWLLFDRHNHQHQCNSVVREYRRKYGPQTIQAPKRDR